ncbi:carbohydrate ABC transporter permease [Salininema proteolyticum]|uniref:Carbohydrate ABC transporter permease n=1 Tax=Salininema proteolyticum TaxID=1607685 RepID=A0ABV8U127_9ACTN
MKTLAEKLSSRAGSLAAVLIAMLWTLPTAGLFVNSLRPPEDVTSTGWWTVASEPAFTLETYNYVLYSDRSGGGLANYFVNSLVIAVPSVLLPIAIGCMAAYAIAWIRFKGRLVLFVAIFALQIVPLQMVIVPLLKMFSEGVQVGGVTLMPGWGLDGFERYVQIWVAHTVFGLPLVVFLMHNFIREIPGEVVEAARVDGAGHVQIFRKVVVPLAAPAIASIGIFQFLWVWNDYLVGLVFGGGPATNPLTVALANLVGATGDNWARLPAAAFVSIIVPLSVFLFLQKYFVRGLLAGSVKG